MHELPKRGTKTSLTFFSPVECALQTQPIKRPNNVIQFLYKYAFMIFFLFEIAEEVYYLTSIQRTSPTAQRK